MRNRTVRNLAVGVVILVAAIALGAAGALAAADVLGDDDSRQAVIDDAADQLGIEPEALSDALREALKTRIDEAVDDGWLSDEEGERLKDRIDSSDTPLVFPGFDRPFGRLEPGVFGPGFFGRGPFGLQRLGAHLDLDVAAAAYLDLTRSELRDRLEEGESLADVARDRGKSVDGLVEALVDAAEERIDRAAERGHLSEERAEELKSRLEDRVRDRVTAELRFRPFDFGHFGPRWRGRHG